MLVLFLACILTSCCSQQPSLIFFCELSDADISTYYDNTTLLSYLTQLNATVSIATSNLSDARAHAINKLNKANISVTLWIVTPWDYGYWENMDNYHYVAYQRYQEIKQWMKQYSLNANTFGLDLEIDGRFLIDWNTKNFSAIYQREKSRNISQLYEARNVYKNLTKQIQNDGYFVETYVIPFIFDEREVDTTIFERVTAITDIGQNVINYEIPMLYSASFPFGKGILANYSYTNGIGGIGLGVTDTGVADAIIHSPYKNWQQFANDLIFSVNTPYGNRLYIYALEGCFNNERNWLQNMTGLDWNNAILDPLVKAEYEEEALVVSNARVVFQQELLKWDHI